MTLLYIGLGILIGFLSGLFGVGGSSVATPILRLLDVPRLLALGTPLPVTLPTALIGGWAYWRRGRVNTRAVGWTAVGGVPAVVLGAYLTSWVPGRVLMAGTGLFVGVVGLRLLIGSGPGHIEEFHRSEETRWFIMVGMGVGFLSGLLANGGGFLLLPAYMLLFHFSPQEAAATSLVAVSIMAIPGTCIHFQLGHIDFRIAGLMAVGVIPSTYLGARLGMLIPTAKARILFGVFLLVFGIFFLVRTIYRAELYGWMT